MAECLVHEFQQGFAKFKSDLSTTDVDQQSMTMISQQRMKLGPRHLALSKRKARKCGLERLLKLGLIELSNNRWTSPVVLVAKKDGSLCGLQTGKQSNFEGLIPTPSHWWFNRRFPWVEGVFHVGVGQWLLAGVHGSWRCVESSLCYTIRPMPVQGYSVWLSKNGLVNAPASFEWMMECILSGLHWKTCLIYLNDVIIFSKTFEDHITLLHQVLTWLKEANLRLFPSKCKLFRPQVEYLGMWSPKMEWLQNLRKLQLSHTPKNPKEVGSFVIVLLLPSFCEGGCWHRPFTPPSCRAGHRVSVDRVLWKSLQNLESFHIPTHFGLSEWWGNLHHWHWYQWLRTGCCVVTSHGWHGMHCCIFQSCLHQARAAVLCYWQGTLGSIYRSQTLPPLPVWLLFHIPNWSLVTQVVDEFDKSWGADVALVTCLECLLLWDTSSPWQPTQKRRWLVS